MTETTTRKAAPAAHSSRSQAPAEHEGHFSLVEFHDVPEPMVAAHIPMQED